MEVKQTEFGTRKNILFNLDPYTARPIKVADTGIVAGTNGRKVVPAGSILDAAGELANDATARYILLQDIDVTAGDSNGAGVYRGTIDLAKLPIEPSEDAQIALKGIIFMSDEDLDYVGGYGDDEADSISERVTALEEAVGDSEDGLVADVAALDATINTATTGLVDRVEVLEAAE